MTRWLHARWGLVVVPALVLSGTSPAVAATQFVGQSVHSAETVGLYTSLALGTMDDPRIGYWSLTRQELKFASKSTGVWTLETPESTAAVGLHTSLAIEAGSPRISYWDATGGDVKYVSRTSGAWVLEIVDTAGVVGQYTSLALDALGNPHVSYYDQTHGDLKHASKSGGVWTVETVDAAADVGLYTSLKLDAQGNPCVSYWDSSNGDLKYARRSGGIWSVETVDDAGVVGEYTSLALDGLGDPRISYFDATQGDLKLASRIGGLWTLEAADTAGVVGQYTSIVLDAQGNPDISYYDVTKGDLKFLDRRIGKTSDNRDTIIAIPETVDPTGNVGRFTSLALDAQGDPWIGYWDASAQNLKQASREAGMWTIEVVDAAGDVGQYASLALDGGSPLVSYWDATRRDLKLASRSGGGWTLEIADDGGNVGQYASLALDSQGVPSIGYWDDSYGVGNLKLASRLGGVWALEEVDTAGVVGQYASLAVDGQGNPRISYYDATNGDLKFASKTGGAWTVETVDAAGDVGQYTSLVLDGQGDARVSYYDATNGDLKFASRAGAAWTVETVDAAGDVGQYASLALDGQGDPRIGYYDATQGDLKFASRAGVAWTIETVDAAGDVGQHVSLALARSLSTLRPADALGDPRISYRDAASSNLKFASKTGGVWAVETVDAPGDVGQYTALVLDARANARASYWDATNGDLKYTVQHYPDIQLWAFPGFYTGGGDSIRAGARGTTLRWVRDPVAESRPDFGGYRIYRVFNSPDTSRLELIRRFAVTGSDALFLWHFPRISESTPVGQRIATFVDPDSSGTFFKRCRRDSLGRCYSPGDSIIVLLPPPGPHDGFRTWYAITYDARNIQSNDYVDLFLSDAIGCSDSNRSTCPNLNHKARNLVGPIEPTAGPTQNLLRVSVVPNPFRAAEAWDLAGGREIHFINLPPEAKISIYTVAGDLVAELDHRDPVRDFERWDLKNGRGREVSSGIYIYRVVSANFSFQDRFVVIR